jgi:hypothetical protein
LARVPAQLADLRFLQERPANQEQQPGAAQGHAQSVDGVRVECRAGVQFADATERGAKGATPAFGKPVSIHPMTEWAGSGGRAISDL